MWGDIINTGVGLLGDALSAFGAKKANDTSQKLAREQMDFQRQSNRESMGFAQDSAREQMGFQERMSNTSYQRAMQDMKSAGLNPILAFNQGGASSPSGQSASGQSSNGALADTKNVLARGLSSAIDARRAYAEISNMKAQNELLKAQTRETNVRAVRGVSDTYKNFSPSPTYWMTRSAQSHANSAKASKALPKKVAKVMNSTVLPWEKPKPKVEPGRKIGPPLSKFFTKRRK